MRWKCTHKKDIILEIYVFAAWGTKHTHMPWRPTLLATGIVKRYVQSGESTEQKPGRRVARVIFTFAMHMDEKRRFVKVMQPICKPATTMSSKAIPTLSGVWVVLGLLRTI